MATDRHGYMVDQTLLDERGLRKKPHPSMELTKDEKRVVMEYVDQSFTQVYLVDGRKVRLRELREHIYSWFPHLRKPRKQVIRTCPDDHAARCIGHYKVDEVTYRHIVDVANILLNGNYRPLETLAGNANVKRLENDIEFMLELAKLWELNSKILISSSLEIWNALKVDYDKNNHVHVWVYAAFATRPVDDPVHLLYRVRQMLFSLHNPIFDDENRRLTMEMFRAYRLWKAGRLSLLKPTLDPSEYLAMLNNLGDGRLLKEPQPYMLNHWDRVFVRTQYLLIEKILKKAKG